jgi:drug/metabolite transporter (DMT)-like permease
MTRRGWLLFGVMCVVWGIPYLLIRVAVRELTPAALVFGRTALATLILLPLAAHRRELRPLVARWRPLVAFAVIEIGIPWVLLSSAEKTLTSSLTALLIAATPLVSVAIVLVTGDDDRLSRRRLAGLLVGIAGVAAVVGLDVGRVTVPALVQIAAVTICYSTGPIILTRWLSDLPSIGVIAASVTLCAIVYAPVAAIQAPRHVPSVQVIASVVGLAVVCTALAFVLFFELIAEVGPVRSTVITYINPAVATILGVTILNETFTAGMAIGFVLVLLGSYLATLRTRVVEPA